MKTIELLEQVVKLQHHAAKRGLEYLYAVGTMWIFHPTPDKFEFTKDGVEMTFEEDTRHDSPDRESISLSIAELEMSNEDWAKKIEAQKAETKRKNEEKETKAQELILASKRKQLATLKAELGEN